MVEQVSYDGRFGKLAITYCLVGVRGFADEYSNQQEALHGNTDHSIQFSRGRGLRKKLGTSATGSSEFIGRVPRVAQLLALAIRLDGLIRAGVVADQAELARTGQVTRARLSQIMNLLCLAPGIQEAILFSSPVVNGRPQVTDRDLSPIAAEASWARQQRAWAAACK